jgi:rfaE bifunctional protein nucleotidyltransferase chain/domain
MGTGESWGFESGLSGDGYGGKRMVVLEQHRTPLLRWADSCRAFLVAPDGLFLYEHGVDPDAMNSCWLSENEKVDVPKGTWCRLTAIRTSVAYEFSGGSEDVPDRKYDGGKVADEAFKDLLIALVRDTMSPRILLPDDASDIASDLRNKGRIIGLCDGTFDLFHLGHAELLLQARQRCEFLFVAVSSDEAVKVNKGKSRPFVDEAGRSNVVASTRFADQVILNGEPSCVKVIEVISPNVYVTTVDRDGTPETKAAAKAGAEVHLVDLIAGYGTSKTANAVSSAMK